MQCHVTGFGAAPERGPQGDVIGLGHVEEARAEGRVVRTDQRIGAGPVDVVRQHHQAAGRHFVLQAACGVRQHQTVDAECGEGADRQHDVRQRMAFIGMGPALQDEDLAAGERAVDQRSVMTFDTRFRKAGYIGERD